MKRIFTILISAALLIGMLLPMGISAETTETPTGIDQNLVVHYDFNGETLEEQLADKAPAGVSKENLTLFSTNDETTQTPLSYVSDGAVHIDHAINNYMQVMFNADENIGTDVLNCNTSGEMTIFTAFKVSGAPQAWATALDFNNVERLILKGSSGNTAIFSTMVIRGTTTMNNNANVDFAVKNADVYHDTDVVYIAVSYNYDAATKKLVGTVYMSFDYGKTYTETPGLFENVDEFMSQCAHICFGKTRAGNQFKKTDHGSSYDFYDFRVYNKALNLDEVKTIATGHEPTEPDTDAPGTDDPGTNDPSTDDPGTNDPGTTDPDTNTPDTNDSNTDTAPEDDTTVTEQTTTGTSDKQEEESGCGSVISIGGISIIALVALAGTCFVRKKE